MFTTPKLSGEYTYYYSRDPAFDFDSETHKHDKWVETGDESLLCKRPGLEPVRFVLRHLPHDEMQFIRDLAASDGSNTAASWGVALALADIVPFVVDGKERKLTRVSERHRLRVSRGDMDLLAGYESGLLIAELVTQVFRGVFSDPK